MISITLCTLVILIGALSVSALPRQNQAALPDYVITYAPYSHLYSKEQFWPSDVGGHIQHVQPQKGSTVLNPSVTLQALSSYGSDTYLTSKDNQLKANTFEWMVSPWGKPDNKGHSGSPATIIAVPKPGGILDAFYFNFYSYNLAPKVIDLYFGNHVGDWEYSMVRFVDGVPAYFYLSEHSGGSAYEFSAVEKTNGRPTSYIALGSHANYATGGIHDYADPLGVVHDTTDRGPPWDVTLNYRGFWYDVSSQVFTSSGGFGLGAVEQASEGVGWLSFAGQWGDAEWPRNRTGQYCLGDQCHITSGPTGPFVKNLGRKTVCEHESNCRILKALNVTETEAIETTEVVQEVLLAAG